MGKSWDGSDDKNYEYLAFIAISKDGPTHISQVSNSWTTAISCSQYSMHVKIIVFKWLTLAQTW